MDIEWERVGVLYPGLLSHHLVLEEEALDVMAFSLPPPKYAAMHGAQGYPHEAFESHDVSHGAEG